MGGVDAHRLRARTGERLRALERALACVRKRDGVARRDQRVDFSVRLRIDAVRERLRCALQIGDAWRIGVKPAGETLGEGRWIVVHAQQRFEALRERPR